MDHGFKESIPLDHAERHKHQKAGCKERYIYGVLTKKIRPAAARAGIKKRIGWHTFRHTYSSTLIANGENVKVVRELVRHASSRFTLEVYTQAKIKAKRDAQQRIAQMVLSEEEINTNLRLERKGPVELMGGSD